MPNSGPRAATPGHTALVAALAFTAGSVDAVTLMALGGAFTSVITGNLIFIGRAIGTSTLTPAIHALIALAGYVCGVAGGARVGHLLSRSDHDVGWPRRASVVLALEFALLITLNVVWIGYAAHPPSRTTDVLLWSAAVALGMQGAAARLIEPAPSTTYMTGALTILIEALSTGRHHRADTAAMGGLLALVAGAASSALLVEHAARLALLPPALTLGCVVAVKRRHHLHDERGSLPRHPAV